MAYRIRSNLETRTARLALDARNKPYTQRLAPCIHLGYRRVATGSGTWAVIVKRHPEFMCKLGTADDFESANGETVLDYSQVVPKALAIGRDGEGNSGAIATVAQAVESYEADLLAAGRSTYNASTLLKQHLPAPLASKPVAVLKKRDFTSWWTSMLKKGLAPTSVERYAKSLRSALTQAADDDSRIKNGKAWKDGLRGPAKANDDDDATETVRNNFILPDSVVTAIMYACHDDGREHGDDFGMLIDIMSECGCRESQALRLKPRHLHDDPVNPTLTIPTSRKGLNRKKLAKKVKDYDVPISQRLAALLRERANSRAANEPLLIKLWGVVDRFRVVVERLGLDAGLTPYCLRYSSIARQLLHGLPMAVVAKNHDTSTAVIEAFYAAHLNKAKKADALTRAALIDHARPEPASNVTPIRAAR
ncbi:tyrosine-type recombinase/integrase [Bradyrhizobium diazoefficiens]